MAWSNNAPVENCGQIWFNELACSIGFVCNLCVDEHPELKGALIDTE